MGTIKADTVTGLADPYKATIPNTITMGSTTATLNFGNTAIANASAGSSTITGEGGSNTTNLQQGLAKSWITFKSDSTFINRDSFNQLFSQTRSYIIQPRYIVFRLKYDLTALNAGGKKSSK